ncbi:hypothetical protein ACJX0J_037469, partial [Zea mays]
FFNSAHQNQIAAFSYPGVEREISLFFPQSAQIFLSSKNDNKSLKIGNEAPQEKAKQHSCMDLNFLFSVINLSVFIWHEATNFRLGHKIETGVFAIYFVYHLKLTGPACCSTQYCRFLEQARARLVVKHVFNWEEKPFRSL